MEGIKGYSERELTEERLYFSKEDERALRKLLSKAKKQADVDPATATLTLESEMKQLKDILGKYQLTDTDYKKVIEWKHADDH